MILTSQGIKLFTLDNRNYLTKTDKQNPLNTLIKQEPGTLYLEILKGRRAPACELSTIREREGTEEALSLDQAAFTKSDQTQGCRRPLACIPDRGPKTLASAFPNACPSLRL